MARKYRKFDEDFKQGAVQLVVETGKPIAQVARDLGINEGTLGNWCARERRARKKDRSLDPAAATRAGLRSRGLDGAPARRPATRLARGSRVGPHCCTSGGPAGTRWNYHNPNY